MKKVLLTTALFFAALNPLWLTLLRLMTLQLGNWQVIFRSLSMMMKI